MAEPSEIQSPLRLAKATRLSGIRRRSSMALTRQAERCLFEHLSVLSEGQIEDTNGERRYRGSTMLTFDIRPLADQWRGAFDERSKEELLSLMEGSVRVRLRVHRIARREAARRLAGANLGTVITETRLSTEGPYVHMDVDLDVLVEVCSASGQET